MFRWIAILAVATLAIGAAHGQSAQPQPNLPLNQNQPMGHMGPMMHGGAMGMDPGMMSMMMQMMGGGMMGQGMGPGMMNHDMSGSMMCRGQMGMMGGMSGAPASHLEGRLAFTKAELAIDSAQDAAWQAYATALRGQVQAMPAHKPGMQHAMAGDADFPTRLDARIAMLEERLSSIKAVKATALDLYGKLNPEQKRKADSLLPMSLCL